MDDIEFHISEQYSPFVLENIRKAFKSWCSIFGIDPMATKFTINAGSSALHLHFYNKSNNTL